MRAALLALLLVAGCGNFDPAELPRGEEWIVAVKSARLPPSTPTLVGLAHHSWFDVKRGGEDRWRRLEVITNHAFTDDDVYDPVWISAATARSTTRWGRDVFLHQVVVGDEAKRIAAFLEQAGQEYEDSNNYRGWAGPNSNTFVDRLGRACDGLRFELHHNCVGKDYTPLVRAGLTSTGMGLELEFYPFGFQLGLEEGIQFHFLNLTFGIDLFPPAITLPFLPRLGFQETTFFR